MGSGACLCVDQSICVKLKHVRYDPSEDKTPLSIKINNSSKMKGEDDDLCICGRTLIVGNGTVYSPGFVTISPNTGLIKAVSSGTPPDQGNFMSLE